MRILSFEYQYKNPLWEEPFPSYRSGTHKADAKPHGRPPALPVMAVKLVTTHSLTPFICQKSHSLQKMCHINLAKAISPSHLLRFTASWWKRLSKPHIAEYSCHLTSGRGKGKSY